MQPWFSIYHINEDYKGSEPRFLDPANFSWASEISGQFAEIKSELFTYLKKKRLEAYFNTSMVSEREIWKTIALKSWNIELFKNQKHFPITSSLIHKYPFILSASFNLLEPRGKIFSHCGDTNAIYRCHLGLDVPAGLPDCGFKVEGEARSWENGKWLIFHDSYRHEAWNNTDAPRYIFVVDVLKKEYADYTNKIVGTVRASLFIQKRAERIKFIRKLPQPVIRGMVAVLRPFAVASVWLFNGFKIF